MDRIIKPRENAYNEYSYAITRLTYLLLQFKIISIETKSIMIEKYEKKNVLMGGMSNAFGHLKKVGNGIVNIKSLFDGKQEENSKSNKDLKEILSALVLLLN